MSNPNGPYPGRQIFLGKTKQGNPCFAYLVTGRSPQSRERRATITDHGIIMGPVGNEPYDWLRHYTAVMTDENIGLAAVTNGIQTEALFETYRLLFHTKAGPGAEYMATIMTGAQYEPDSLRTPRIASVITFAVEKTEPVYILSIITDSPPANTWVIRPERATLTGISTYNGDLESPRAFDVSGDLPVIENEYNTPAEIADYIYRISEATNQGDDIRVCTIGGVLSDDNNTWELSMINRHVEK
jgi:IMP cyclohydrolase